MLKVTEYIRKPDIVVVVQVTETNHKEIDTWLESFRFTPDDWSSSDIYETGTYITIDEYERIHTYDTEDFHNEFLEDYEEK